VVIAALELTQKLHASHERHTQIGHDDIEELAVEERERFAPGSSRPGLEPRLRKQTREHFAHRRIIVDDQHPSASGPCHLARLPDARPNRNPPQKTCPRSK
jgi:hypothetical protein